MLLDFWVFCAISDVECALSVTSWLTLLL